MVTFHGHCPYFKKAWYLTFDISISLVKKIGKLISRIFKVFYLELKYIPNNNKKTNCRSVII